MVRETSGEGSEEAFGYCYLLVHLIPFAKWSVGGMAPGLCKVL